MPSQHNDRPPLAEQLAAIAEQLFTDTPEVSLTNKLPFPRHRCVQVPVAPEGPDGPEGEPPQKPPKPEDDTRHAD